MKIEISDLLQRLERFSCKLHKSKSVRQKIVFAKNIGNKYPEDHLNCLLRKKALKINLEISSLFDFFRTSTTHFVVLQKFLNCCASIVIDIHENHVNRRGNSNENLLYNMCTMESS